MKHVFSILIILSFLCSSCEEKVFDNPNEYAGYIEMVTVQGGTFTMGRDDYWQVNTGPAHSVTLDDYQISVYEITTTQFCRFLNDIDCSSNGYYDNKLFISMGGPFPSNIEYLDRNFIPKSGKENHAVYQVTWYGADEYCNWADGRLPTEAEWEYAARGGSKNRGYDYSGSNDLSEINTVLNTSPVGSKMANEIGLHDMTGNAAEWGSDWYESYISGDQYNPQGPTVGDKKVLRGQGIMKVFERFSLKQWKTGGAGVRLVRDIEN